MGLSVLSEIRKAKCYSIIADEATEQQRRYENFQSIYEDVLKSSKDLTAPPSLQRYRSPPRRPDEASSTSHEFTSTEFYFRQ